jgi:hypothetical protein
VKLYLGDEVDTKGFAPSIVSRAKKETLTCTEEGREVSVEGYTVEAASLEELVVLLKEQRGCLVLLECTFPGIPLAVDPYYPEEV